MASEQQQAPNAVSGPTNQEVIDAVKHLVGSSVHIVQMLHFLRSSLSKASGAYSTDIHVSGYPRGVKDESGNDG